MSDQPKPAAATDRQWRWWRRSHRRYDHWTHVTRRCGYGKPVALATSKRGRRRGW